MPQTAKADVTYSGPSTSAVVADPGQQPMMAIAAAPGFPDPLMAVPIASWANNPAFNLGDALSFFRYDQVQNLTSQPSLHHQQEQLNLPSSSTFPQGSNSALISSLISTDSSITSSSGSTTPSTGTSSRYVPIAPAPPTDGSGNLTMKTSSYMGASTNTNDSSSVLTAMKVQHIAPAPLADQRDASSHCFTNPGPALFAKEELTMKNSSIDWSIAG